jgi:hypothetical protein
LDSASLNYPGTDTLVLAIELAEICVMNLNRPTVLNATNYVKDIKILNLELLEELLHLLQGRPTCGPEIFLCGPNWIQNSKKKSVF